MIIFGIWQSADLMICPHVTLLTLIVCHSKPPDASWAKKFRSPEGFYVLCDAFVSRAIEWRILQAGEQVYSKFGIDKSNDCFVLLTQFLPTFDLDRLQVCLLLLLMTIIGHIITFCVNSDFSGFNLTIVMAPLLF